MKEKLAKLIDVKSIVTIVLTGIFSYLAVAGIFDRMGIEPPNFLPCAGLDPAA